MESQLRELMQSLVGDPPHQVTAQAVRRRVVRRRRMSAIAGTVAAIAVIAAVIPAFVGAYSGINQSGNRSLARSYITQLPDGRGRLYHDAAGWVIDVPPGWHVLSFHSSKDGATAAGAQISNMILPAPTIMPGFLIQASGQTLPAHGVSLVIAADHDPKLCWHGQHHLRNGVVSSCHITYSPLPISFRKLLWGSAPAASPVTGFLWFKANGKAVSLTATFGSNTFSQRYIDPLSKVIESLRTATSKANP